MKKILFSALALGLFTATGFAGNPKEGVKESKETSPSKSEATAKTETLYWYQVTYNTEYGSGAILSDEDLHDVGEKSEIASPCAAGPNNDCLRGFSAPLDDFPNTTVPTNEDQRIRKL